MKLKALLTSLIVLGSAEVADPISEASRYKTWGREVLTHADLNALQDHFAGKINEIIVATADSNYQKMTVDTLTAAHSVTVANVELSKTTHGHADVHYTETEIDATLGGYAVFSHGHTAGTILSDNKTGTGKFVFHTSPVLAGTPKVSESGADYRIWHAGPSGMGAASGLHADILDSQEGAYYAATGAEGAVQFRKSDGSFHNSSNFGYLVESGSGTSQLAVGGAAASNMELTVGQPSGATTANTEIYIRADSGENASLELAEGDDRRQTVTMTGSNDGLIIGPHPATAANGIMVSSSGKVGVEASPDGTADLTLGSGGVKFSDATTLTSANHAHSGLVDDGGNSGTNGVSVNTSTGNVGIEVAPDGSADLTLGSGGLKFASDPGYDFTQVSGYTRWGNDSGTAKGKGNGTSSLSGNKTINHVFTDAEINQAFTRNYGAVVFDNESDSDPTNFAIYVDADGDGDEAGEYGNLVFYHSNIPTGSGAAGAVLAVNEYGISVGGKQKSSSYSLNVDGSGLFSGSVQENSDARYKENTQPLTGALDKVKTLDAFSYQWQTGSPVGAGWVNRDSTTKAQYLGVSAQELQAVYPNLFTGSDASGYSVNYSRLTVVLLAAIQELEARVATLEAQ